MRSLPWMASQPPSTATPTYPRFPTNIMIGNISPEKNWERHALPCSLSLIALKVSTDFRSVPNALITVWPENISSTCPFELTERDLLLDEVRLRAPVMNRMSSRLTGKIRMATSVSCQLIVNIMIRMPISLITEVTIC